MSERADLYFNGLAKSFESDIYQSSKGYIRLNVLWHDLLEQIPSIKDGNLNVLDAGGGMGQIAVKLGKMGNNVLICDPSKEMLAKARKKINNENIANKVRIINSNIQELEKKVQEKFDLVVCHTVLEWLASPKQILGNLLLFLKQNGLLSLMFFNRNAAILRDIFAGDFKSSLEFLYDNNKASGFKNKSKPLDQRTVFNWLNEMNFKIKHKSGIRIFHDYLPDKFKSAEKMADLLDIEKSFRSTEPFTSIAQHIHLICQLNE